MKKYDNFCKALLNLEDSCRYREPYDNVVLSGLVALFEICFEQAWKAMKETLKEDGAPWLPRDCQGQPSRKPATWGESAMKRAGSLRFHPEIAWRIPIMGRSPWIL